VPSALGVGVAANWMLYVFCGPAAMVDCAKAQTAAAINTGTTLVMLFMLNPPMLDTYVVTAQRPEQTLLRVICLCASRALCHDYSHCQYYKIRVTDTGS
jgi:hypothetical protein